jgi:hypothetical protein
MLKIEIGAKQVSFDALAGRRDREKSCLDIAQPVKLERDIRLQQIKIARMRQQWHRAFDRPLDRAQLDQIAGNRSTLVQTINVLGQAFRVDRKRERIGNAQLGDVLLDAPQFGLVPRHRCQSLKAEVVFVVPAKAGSRSVQRHSCSPGPPLSRG